MDASTRSIRACRTRTRARAGATSTRRAPTTGTRSTKRQRHTLVRSPPQCGLRSFHWLVAAGHEAGAHVDVAGAAILVGVVALELLHLELALDQRAVVQEVGGRLALVRPARGGDPANL